MKKILVLIGCLIATVTLQAQESVVLKLDIRPNTSFEIVVEDKNSTITNLLGNKEIIALIKQEGAEYPAYETQESIAAYTLHWVKESNKKLNFDLDLDRRTLRDFKANALVSTEKETAQKNFTAGALDVKKGLTLTKSLNDKYKDLGESLTTLLDDLFNSSGFSKTPIKVNETFTSSSKKTMQLSEDHAVETSTRDDSKLVKIENHRAYLTIESTITSESKGTKFAEMKGSGTKEIVYNIEKQYIESISGTVNIIVNIETEGGLTINMNNTVTQKISSKQK